MSQGKRQRDCQQDCRYGGVQGIPSQNPGPKRHYGKTGQILNQVDERKHCDRAQSTICAENKGAVKKIGKSDPGDVCDRVAGPIGHETEEHKIERVSHRGIEPTRKQEPDKCSEYSPVQPI